jgi:tetratricopeptide (TPR) repeat protein
MFASEHFGCQYAKSFAGNMEIKLHSSAPGEAYVRYWSVILFMGTAMVSAASGHPTETAAQSERDGRSFLLACEFKQATRAFENALAEQPESAALHYWLGKSYARLAEVSSSLSAPKNARKARRSLEQAVKIDPRSDEYMQELFEFYVDSPEWRISGGSQQAAALLERFANSKSGAEPRLKQLADSRKEHSGAGWWMRRAVLWTSEAIGYVVPQP